MDGLNVKDERIWTGGNVDELEMMKKGERVYRDRYLSSVHTLEKFFEIFNTYDVKMYINFKDIFSKMR